MWLFLLSRLFIDPNKVSIPYFSILLQLAVFVVPCIFGVLLRKFKPPAGIWLARFIKPFALVFLIYLLSFGIYVNRYVFSMWAQYPRILVPALLQPYLGFTLAFLISRFAARQPRYRAITISIETGIQNAAIPMLMLQGSFEQPFGDTAATMPVTTALYTPIPLLCTFIGLMSYKFCCKKRCGKGDEDEEKKMEDEEEEEGQICDKEMEARAEQKSRELDKGYSKSHRPERDSLLIKNGLTGSALGRQFFMMDKESTI